MSIERKSCIHPFIEKAQFSFNEGESLREVLGTIRDYQKRVSGLVTNISPEARLPHLIGLSVAGLTAVATYEYLRYQGMPLPDSREIISNFVPVVSLTQKDDVFDDVYTKEWAEFIRREGKDPTYAKDIDAHRKEAHGRIDRELEKGEISPRDAQREKSVWDKRHGY